MQTETYNPQTAHATTAMHDAAPTRHVFVREDAVIDAGRGGDGSAFGRMLGEAIDKGEQEAERRAELQSAAEQLVATTFIMPLFAQLRNDPLASELFHGGRGEKIFQQQLDQEFSDRIATGARFDLVASVMEQFDGQGNVSPGRSASRDATAVVDGAKAAVTHTGVDLHG